MLIQVIYIGRFSALGPGLRPIGPVLKLAYIVQWFWLLPFEI